MNIPGREKRGKQV